MKDYPNSSLIYAAGHDGQHLTVQFRAKDGGAGDTWRYHDVPAELHQQFDSAESQGRFFHRAIRGAFHGVKV